MGLEKRDCYIRYFCFTRSLQGRIQDVEVEGEQRLRAHIPFFPSAKQEVSDISGTLGFLMLSHAI